MKHIVVILVLLAGISAAHADRMPYPKQEICNKSKTKAHIATAGWDTYMGWSTQGWQLLKPKQCRTFETDAFYVRGKRAVINTGKTRQSACVLDAKQFRVESKTADGNGEKECREKKGRMVPFYVVKAGKKPPSVSIVK